MGGVGFLPNITSLDQEKRINFYPSLPAENLVPRRNFWIPAQNIN